ncbi:MAG: 50S ribosomal protein L11 methyltransferase [Candidatus Omnitrophica bacterium]|nr:50S ribosomal protein L11 methyltransferase [Candidatus Omnitrophota bacterium]
MGPLSGGRIHGTYFEVSLSGKETPSAEKEARLFFLRQRIAAGQIAVSGLNGRLKISFYSASPAPVRKTQLSFEKHPVPGLRLSHRRLGPQDWRDRWQKYFHLRNVGRRFTVVPERQSERFRERRRLPLYLDPEGAFGTGFHETTRFTLILMERFEGHFESFLDLGCGSGILSAAAGRLGARHIQAVEKHGPSLATARNNLRLNGVRAKRLFHGDLKNFRPGRRFDLVCANLLSSVLLENRCRIAGWVKRGGYLVVSGLLRKESREFAPAFAGAELRLQAGRHGRKWSALLFVRR